MRVVLASASPARLATLRAAGIEPEVVVSGVDESAVATTDPYTLTQLLATTKARVVAADVPVDQPSLVIGCDSVLSLDKTVLGKPGTSAEATARWRRMRGCSATLVTGHCVIASGSGQEVTASAATDVWFADLSDGEIDAYVATGEPLNVAGGFTIDGLGGPFVTRIDGDHHNVVGISLPLLRDMVSSLGIDWTTLWATAGERPHTSPT